MGHLLQSVMMLIPLTCFIWLPVIVAQSSSKRPARALDALLQEYAYRAFVSPKTGVSYEGVVPSNLTGIKIAAMRLRSGSLKNKGVKRYKEFEIPMGVVEGSYVERLVLVYQNLGNWSTVFYPLDGYTYLAPVLGLLAYDASNLSARNLPELDVKASNYPILIKFPGVRSARRGSFAKCVWFDLQGSVNITNTIKNNVCATSQQGHFSIVMESITPSAPSVVPRSDGEEKKKNNPKVWLIAGSVVGGLALLVLSSVAILWAQQHKQKRNMSQMEKDAALEQALQMISVGNTRAPLAPMTRTQPVLET